MVTLINFHMHSTGSDGRLSPEEVVKEAINGGIHYMCFTDHYRRPKSLKTGWNTLGFHSKEYVEEIRRLQKEYKDKIDISYGAEVDYMPGHKIWIKNELAKEKYDFIIGSVHLIFGKDKIHHFMYSNGQGSKWKTSAEDFGGVKSFVKAYYRQLRDMIKSGLYDSVGHFDVIKIHNNPQIFSENEKWYTDEVIKTLDILKKSKMAMEINTSGISRDVGEVYPSPWILKEAKKRNIPLTIGTDSHSGEFISKELLRAYALAKEAGYSQIVRFKDRKMISISI